MVTTVLPGPRARASRQAARTLAPEEDSHQEPFLPRQAVHHLVRLFIPHGNDLVKDGAVEDPGLEPGPDALDGVIARAPR